VAEAPRLSPLEGCLPPGRHGAADGDAGLAISAIVPGAMAQIHGAHGADALSPVLGLLGMEGDPAPRRALAGATGRLLWNGPGQYLAVSDAHADTALADALEEGFGGRGPVAVDVSHARAVLRVRGPAARDTLATGCPLDVDALVPGDAMPTVIGHFNVLLHCAEADGFELYVTRSFAAAFAEWLLEAGAGYGVQCD